MGDRPALDPSARSIAADQAVFTSLRSPMGDGYRIVSCSSGLEPQEKMELTRRCPSHGGLCDPSADAWGLASYPLQSGRHCVSFSCYAGREHTSRGGQRVYTRIAVLRREDFRILECNPLRVCAALRPPPGEPISLKTPPHLEPLNLSRTGPGTRVATPDPREIERVTAVLYRLLQDDGATVRNVTAPGELAACLIQALPLDRRAQFSCSAGIRFSPRRDFKLIILQEASNRARRRGGHEAPEHFDWQQPPADDHGPFQAWLDFARRFWEAGRGAALDRCAVQLYEGASACGLAQFAELYEAVERAEHLDGAQLSALLAAHRTTVPCGKPQQELLARLRCTATARLQEFQALLTAASQDSAAAETSASRDGAGGSFEDGSITAV